MSIKKLDVIKYPIELCSAPFFREVLGNFTNLSTRFKNHQRRVGDVDLEKVIGTAHPDYGNHAWGDLLPNNHSIDMRIRKFPPKHDFNILKRATSNLELLNRNPDYYIGSDLKIDWCFFKIEDSFVIADGNHRTILSRFFFCLNNLPQVVRNVEIVALSN